MSSHQAVSNLTVQALKNAKQLEDRYQEHTQDFHPESPILVLVNEEGQKHVVVPFPETYEDAITVAIRTLGRYMTYASPKVILRCSVKNREEKWVWADIVPETWKATMRQYPKEVGVFEIPQPDTENSFLHGQLHYTAGQFLYGSYRWDSVKSHPNTVFIDRPVNYKVAKDTALKLRSWHVEKSSGQILRFAVFTDESLCSWHVIPTAAHTNDELWRAIVPPPGGVLGVFWEKSDVDVIPSEKSEY